ncbi:MAG: type IV pilus twitching motility protein PilT [Culicoidibacterales bacterium]
MITIDRILQEALQHRASDVHISVDRPPMARIQGELLPLGFPVLTSEDTKRLVYEMLNKEQVAQFEKEQQLDFAYEIKNVSRLRVNAYYQKKTVAIAIRPIAQHIPTFQQLQLPEILRTLSQKQRGLILVTGPTGSGKSTTLAAMVNEINETMHKHIITLEDPVEFYHEHKQSLVNQREVGKDVGDFAKGLKVALRQDPDVIMIGEMRDLETIQIALTAAETGHLVFATLHTSSAASTIERIIDVFPAAQQQQVRTQLANSLVAVVSQRLLKSHMQSGREAAFEIMVCTSAISNLIRSEKVHQIDSMIQTGREFGMKTMQMSLHDLLMQGKITPQQVQSLE